jgi:hypothetical protein
VAGLSISRGAAALAGAGAVVAGEGLTNFAAALLVALGVGPGDSIIRLLIGWHIEPWNLRSIVFALVVGLATAAFLPPLVRGLAGSVMSLRTALIVGVLAALAELAMLDLLQNDRARFGSTGWQLAELLVPPLVAGVLAELSAR